MKTKEDITLAFWKIYAEKKIEKISVRELCQKAGYNRSTFYSYYKDIYDLFDKETDKMISLVKEEFHKINDITNLLQNNFIEQVFLSFYKTNDKYIALIIKNNQSYILEDKLKQIGLELLKEKIDKTNKENEFIQYIIQYQISGVFSILKLWCQNGKSLSEEKLVKIIYGISSKGILNLVLENIKKTIPSKKEKEEDKQLIENILYKLNK